MEKINVETLKFTPLDLKDVKTLVNWAEKEGWNPGPFDADVYWTTDPNGFYGYLHKGELIAGGSIISYNNEFGFMGFFIVKPEYRSYGIGQKLWYQRRDTLISRLKKGASIGMDGVVDMQPFYQKGGFEIAFRDERHEKIGQKFEIDKNISSIFDEDTESILAYDQQCFGFSRPQFLHPWLKLPENKTFKYVQDGHLKGFAIVRKAYTGYKVCPLFADNEIIAEELYKACLNSVVGEPLYIDIPMKNHASVELMKKYETTYVFECARMYYGDAPDIELNKIYGITTFELG
ncbi:GNAT family N-acetyltransferase [Chengkuizengella axinellae]|uniref:GNAT family N-acetyltransferase n=1 Tax=Chengkuizengella axinellae TaxID=3064388 RepID=A0ABT9J3B9_9BACL|nr:GNAT family N-acetyltransferase [Chengkuizengella sp. 2205SS18-9]MDP5275489.1 GNAT family N-acetyltransferase [Chengkuizengella sp. 2205SS18-9]